MSTEPAAWIIKQGLDADELQRYIVDQDVERSQIIALTEPTPNAFTLIYDPTPQQREQAETDEARELNEARIVAEVVEAPPVEAPRW